MQIEEKEYRMLNLPSGDLRISVTNGCNMRCTYCHNEGQDGVGVIFLSVDRVRKIVSNTMKYGLKKIRITGGEPLIHPDIEKILLMIRNEFNFGNVGLNTNGILGEKLLSICDQKLVNRVVVGMDYFDKPISKKSDVGISSREIRNSILELRKMGIQVEIAIVFDNNLKDIFSLVQWGLDNQIVIKIIEKIDYWDQSFLKEDFDQLLFELKKEYSLKLGITADLQEFYLSNGISKIKFFQSHCNRKECEICTRLHMRVTCDGMAKPCINREDTMFPLLEGNFDQNMRMAIANLGNGPGNVII